MLTSASTRSGSSALKPMRAGHNKVDQGLVAGVRVGRAMSELTVDTSKEVREVGHDDVLFLINNLKLQ